MARVVRTAIDAGAVVESVAGSDAGAVLTFSGDVRDHHRGRKVTGIDYHAYESMAVKEMEKIERQVGERWSDCRVQIVHRLGHLSPGETSVLIAVASPHRNEGFEALRYAIDTLKETAPIWKKEMYIDGHSWIEGS